MTERKSSRKYYFSVEGDTEKWYLDWLQKTINDSKNATAHVKFTVKVEKNPCAFVKSLPSLQESTEIVHVIDIEGNDSSNRKTLFKVLENLAKAKTVKSGIKYQLGYCNLSFDLWIILHKNDCFGAYSFNHNYLLLINKAYNTNFENMADYKKKASFANVLDKLVLEDIFSAIKRARFIQSKKRK